jgi:hypothetical protein
MKSIREMVQNKKVTFLYFRDGEFIYETECGFRFPVPLAELGKATLNASDRAIYFMRYIRKHLDLLKTLKENVRRREDMNPIDKIPKEFLMQEEFVV